MPFKYALQSCVKPTMLSNTQLPNYFLLLYILNILCTSIIMIFCIIQFNLLLGERIIFPSFKTKILQGALPSWCYESGRPSAGQATKVL